MISSLSSYHFHNLPHNYTCWTLNTILTDNGTKCCYCMEYILSPHIKGMQHHKLGYLVTTIQSKLFTLESKWMKSLGIVQYKTCTHIQGCSRMRKRKMKDKIRIDIKSCKESVERELWGWVRRSSFSCEVKLAKIK